MKEFQQRVQALENNITQMENNQVEKNLKIANLTSLQDNHTDSAMGIQSAMMFVGTSRAPFFLAPKSGNVFGNGGKISVHGISVHWKWQWTAVEETRSYVSWRMRQSH